MAKFLNETEIEVFMLYSSEFLIQFEHGPYLN